MSSFSTFDETCMRRALELAAKGRYEAFPNPMVGCVIARNGAVLAEGYHARSGSAHAELAALDTCADPRGATAYVTLEPCAHQGKTPPCTTALIEAGVAEVVYAMRDPNPAVDGKGISLLESAGITVRGPLLQADAAALNRGFVSRMTLGRPFVRMKIAASLDGATAMQDGSSQWITGPAARADVQRLRAESGAVLTGIGTVMADDPALTVRDDELATGGRQPLRAVLDSRLRMPTSARMLCLPGTTVVYCVNDAGRAVLEEESAEVVLLPAADSGVGLGAVLADLGQRQINDVLVEAGRILAGSLLQQRLVDELVIYQAPHIMGSETRGMFSTPGWQSLKDRLPLQVIESRTVGADTRITARPAA